MLYICNQMYNSMETVLHTPKVATAFRLNSELIKRLKNLARKDNRSLNNFVESVLMRVAYEQPNKTTIAAFEEAASGKDLETFDMEAFNEYVKSMK